MSTVITKFGAVSDIGGDVQAAIDSSIALALQPYVQGPGAATNDGVPRYDGVTGKKIKSSNIRIDAQNRLLTDRSISFKKVTGDSSADTGTIRLYANLSDGNLRTIDESGVIKTFDAYNQSLNTTNDVTFNSLTTTNDARVMGDLRVDGSIVSEFNVEDSIITINNGAPADTFTTGMLHNNTADTVFSGLLRYGPDKQFYLFNNITPKPTPIMTPAPTPNAVLNMGTVNSILGVFGARSPSLNQYELPLNGTGAANDTMLYSGGPNGTFTISELNFLKSSGNQRIITDGTSSRLIAPDGATSLSVSNADVQLLKNPYGNPRLLINTIQNKSDVPSTAINRLCVNNIDRVYADISNTKLWTPNGNNQLNLQDTQLNYNHAGVVNRLLINGTTSNMMSPDTNTNINVTNDLFTVNTSEGEQIRVEPSSVIIDSGGYGLELTDSQANIYSPDGNQSVFVNNTVVSFATEGIGRLFGYTPTGFDDGSLTLQQQNNTTKMYMKDTFIKLFVESKEQLTVDTTTSKLTSPDAATNLSVTNATAKIIKSAVDRLIVDATGTTILSPNTTTYSTVTNAAAQTVVAGIARAQHTVINSFIQSPDGTNSLIISNGSASIGKAGAATTVVDGLVVGAGVTVGNSIPATNYVLPSTRGTAEQILKTDGSGVVSWVNNNSFGLQYGGNVSGPALRFLPVSGTAVIATDTTLTYQNESIMPYASTLKYFTWSSQSGVAASTVMRVYVNGASALSVTLTGAQGRAVVTLAVADAARVAVAWDPTGGGTRPDNITVILGFT